MTRSLRCAVWLAAGFLFSALGPIGADSANVTMPPSVSFTVTNVNSATTGNPDPTSASYTDAVLTSGYSLRMSIQANAADFTRPAPAGGYIQASDVTWSTSGASGGTGYPGTMSAAGYARVYQSNPDATSGSVSITWTLAAPGGQVRAGDHILTATWKTESL